MSNCCAHHAPASTAATQTTPSCASASRSAVDSQTTILLVGHGSRNPHGNREIEEFADHWRQHNPAWRIEVCFIEYADILLPEGLDRAAQHSQRVLVLPLILNAAGHVKMEMPEAIEAARVRHPKVEFTALRHLGMGEDVCAILGHSLKQVMHGLDMPDPQTTGVILLGRGSSDAGANAEVAKMARWMFEAEDHELVDIAFTGVTFPRLENVVQRQARLGMTQIAVIPVYLFTGVLIERIQRQIERLRQQYPQIAFGLGKHIGFHHSIYTLLNQRIEAALQGDSEGLALLECDGCKYRQEAAAHGHHHHHHDHGHGHSH